MTDAITVARQALENISGTGPTRAECGNPRYVAAKALERMDALLAPPAQAGEPSDEEILAMADRLGFRSEDIEDYQIIELARSILARGRTGK